MAPRLLLGTRRAGTHPARAAWICLASPCRPGFPDAEARTHPAIAPPGIPRESGLSTGSVVCSPPSGTCPFA